MRDDEALLAAITANADEDTPRLMYADWLDENRPDPRPSPARGPNARAEFIRVQCRLAEMTPDHPEYTDLRDRHQDLATWLEAHAKEKRALPGGLLSDSDSYAEYERGFASKAMTNYRDDRRNAAARLTAALQKVVETTPVRTLHIDNLRVAQVAEFLRRPVVDQLRALAVSVFDNDTDDVRQLATALADAPHVRNLRELRLFPALTDAAAEALAGAKSFDGLRALNLDLSTASPDAIRALGRAAWFRNLHKLKLDTQLSDEMLTALAKLPPFPNLRGLDLADNSFTAAGIERLALSKAFPNLVELNLDRTNFGPAGAVDLARAKWKLAELHVRVCGLKNEGMVALAGSPLLAGVKIADFATNGIGAKGMKALAESPHATALRNLEIGYNPIRRSGLLALARGPALRNLTRLSLATYYLDKPRVAVKDVTEFLTHLDMSNLRELALDGMPLGAPGGHALATSTTIGRLTRLSLPNTDLTDASMKLLLAAPHLGDLVEADLCSNKIGASAEGLKNPAQWPRLGKCSLSGNKVPTAIKGKLTRARRGLSA